MIKINLVEKKKSFVAPVVLGVDLSTFPYKKVLLVIIFTQMPLSYFEGYLEDLNAQSKETINSLINEKKKLRREIRKNKKIAKQLDHFNKKIENLKKRGEQVELILKSRTNPRHLLEKIARLTPTKLWLDKLKVYSNKKIQMEGGAEDYRSIGELIKNLNESPFFDGELQIKESKTVTEKIKNRSFRIESFEIEGKIKSFNPFIEGAR
jgi:hypothetical protein